MKKDNALRVGIVTPPLKGHLQRGTGVYHTHLLQGLQKKIDVEEVPFGADPTGFDLFHYTYFDPFFLTLPLVKKVPTIVTIHDLIPIHFPELFPKGIRGSILWQIQRFSLKGVQAVLTDSFASKKDIQTYTSINEKKIHVAYLGISKDFTPALPDEIAKVKKRYALPQNYILYVGDINPNKNIHGILESFSLAHKKLPSLSLLCIGTGFDAPSPTLMEINRKIEQLGISDAVQTLGYIPLEALVAIYSSATLYLHPSLGEGFGFPVLEAMACGCPCIVSNTSSLPEIVGDAAIQVNPINYEDIAQQILSLSRDEDARKELRKKGLKRAKNFTWETCVEETLAVYQQVVSS